MADPTGRAPRMYIRSPLERRIDTLLDVAHNSIRDGFRPLSRSIAEATALVRGRA